MDREDERERERACHVPSENEISVRMRSLISGNETLVQVDVSIYDPFPIVGKVNVNVNVIRRTVTFSVRI